MARRGWAGNGLWAVALGVSAAVFAASPGVAQCATTTFIQIDIPRVTTFYYDDRSELPPVPGVIVGPDGTWVYQESNGEPGLQRGNSCWYIGPLPFCSEEVCFESANPDRLWL